MANSKKKNRRRKTLSTVLILLAILIAGAAVGIKYLRQHVTENYGSKSSDEAQTATVTMGSIPGHYDVFIRNADRDAVVKELKRLFEPVSLRGWRNMFRL